MKLLEKCKQDEAILAEKATSSPKLPPHSPAPVPSTLSSPIPSLVLPSKTTISDLKPAVSAASVVSAPPAVENADCKPKSKITQELLKEIQTTLEERKKLQNYVSKYEKGIHEILENGSSPSHNVSDFRLFMYRLFYFLFMILTNFKESKY